MTLADEDTNSIPSDNAKRVIQGNEAMQVMNTNASDAIWWSNMQLMQVAPSGGQICKLCKWRHLVVKFATNASGAIRWSKIATIASGEIWCLVANFATNASGAIWWPNL